MKVRVIASLVPALCLCASLASAQSIGIFFDPGATDCDAAQAGPNQPAPTWYHIALLGGASADGITGAEYRQDGTPSSWFMTANANPLANLTIGNPIQAGGGVNIAFPDCQTGGGTGMVLLYTVSGFAPDVRPQTYLTTSQHTNPSRPDRLCPSQILCDAPIYTQNCVPGGQAIMNGVPCNVAVEPKSWSQVKGLYN